MLDYRRAALIAAISLTLGSAHAGKIVVNHDEWTFSSAGYAAAGAADTGLFAENVLDFLSDGAGTDVLVYSDNTLLTGTEFDTSASAAGYSVTKTTGLTFDLATLSTYQVIVLGGYYLNAAEVADLITYVNQGGGVYLAGGSGLTGPAAEATAWNPFLNAFGFSFAPVYNGINGTPAVNQTHAIESGVGQIYYNSGNTISLTGGNPDASIIESGAGGAGLLGVYDGVGVSDVPEPSTYAMIGLGVGLILLSRTRK